MIPFIRSISELMAITNARDSKIYISKNTEANSSTVDSGQRKRYIRSLDKKEINLPKLPKTISCKWLQDKYFISRLTNNLDYDNQIHSSYELNLLERQNMKNQQDVA